MNKLHLIFSLATVAYTTDTIGDCEIEWEDGTGNYAFDWTITLDSAEALDLATCSLDSTTHEITCTQWTTDNVKETVLCYNEFIYNFSINEAECATTSASTCDYYSALNFVMYGYKASGDVDNLVWTDVETDDTTVTEATYNADSGDATADPYDGGYITVDS